MLEVPDANTALKPCIGVSSCLAGEKVRYDGDASPHDYINDKLAAVCQLIPVCPEVGIGMGVPRPPIHLVGMPEAPEAVGVDNPELNVTRALHDFARTTAASLPLIAGYIFKSRSPSCGLGSVKVMLNSGEVVSNGNGLYAQSLIHTMPLLPVVDETCLDDPEHRDHFLECVFTYHRWLLFMEHRITVQSLRNFHSRHELLIRARGETAWKTLDAIILEAESKPLEEISERYITHLMRIIQTLLKPNQHVQILKSVVSCLEVELSDHTRAEISRAVNDYDNGIVGRDVPVKKIRAVLFTIPPHRLQKQVYLNPSDQEAELRF
ncbi:MAG: DUF523 and DUF1722 domain-containing protein [Gammaproteobacteria bacterium]